MYVKDTSPKSKGLSLESYRLTLMLLVTLFTGCYIGIELDVLPFDRTSAYFEPIHWVPAGVIWLLGLAGIQFGYRRLGTASAALVAERNNLRAIFDTAQVGMLLIDGRLNVVRLNQAMSQLFDRKADSQESSRHGTVLSCPNAQANPLGCGHTPDCNSCGLMLSLRETLHEGLSTVDKEALLQCAIGGEIISLWILYSVKPIVLDGERFALLSLVDITERRSFQQQLQHMAFFDPLTKLPNRTLFSERLDRLVSDLSRSAQAAAGVMFLDLDGFKTVNDTLGHDAGDQLLRETGERIRNCLRDCDTVARLGGDEFAVILPEVRQELDLATVARKIRIAIESPLYISGKELFITTSIGIACYPSDSNEPTELVRFADAAMYHAKVMGRNNFQFYSASLTEHAAERMELESDLRKALQQGELELYYQPKVDTIGGLLVGAEALLRWNHPTRGLVPPDAFIGIAEDTGLITGIGAWVLHTACLTAREWNRDEHYPVKIAVNLSVRQFMSGDFVDTVRTVLEGTGCRPEWLELEITESMLMANKPEIIASLEALDNMGITIAIDDFGTGYSALSYLTDFPVSTLKIDKSFIKDITAQKRSLELVRAIVSLGHVLGIELVAEGIETGEQAACLDKLGCHVIQGYFYGKPMPVKTFNTWRTDFFNSRQSDDDEISHLTQSSWRDYLTTKHETIDAQHRELFRRITTLSKACRSGKGHHEVSQLLEYLGSYIENHFSAEEELLISVDSPHYTEHKAAHDNFTEVINMLRSRYHESGENQLLTTETNFVAVDWLTKHICTMDRDLADRLRDRNLLFRMGDISTEKEQPSMTFL